MAHPLSGAPLVSIPSIAIFLVVSESRTMPPPWEWHVGQPHLRSACHWLIGRALSHWSSVPWAPRGKCNSCGRPCGAPAVRARAKPGICFLLLPTTSKVYVHCTHEILVVCALCFYMWSLLDSTCGKIWWNVDDIQRPVVLGFAIFVPSNWLHPMTNFQS